MRDPAAGTKTQFNDNDGPGGDLEADEIAETHNGGFTCEVRAEFAYRPDQAGGTGQTLNVLKATNDLWIFIDNKLFRDLGAVHSAIGQGPVSLNAFGSANSLAPGRKYSFDIFYANRTTDDSLLAFETTIHNLTAAPLSLAEKEQFVVDAHEIGTANRVATT